MHLCHGIASKLAAKKHRYSFTSLVLSLMLLHVYCAPPAPQCPCLIICAPPAPQCPCVTICAPPAPQCRCVTICAPPAPQCPHCVASRLTSDVWPLSGCSPSDAESQPLTGWGMLGVSPVFRSSRSAPIAPK